MKKYVEYNMCSNLIDTVGYNNLRNVKDNLTNMTTTW